MCVGWGWDGGTRCAFFLMKAFGLMLAAGGGLNIGREGPYTHMAGMVSYQLINNVPFFHDILAKETVLRQVRADGGVANSVTVGAPCGAVERKGEAPTGWRRL